MAIAHKIKINVETDWKEKTVEILGILHSKICGISHIKVCLFALKSSFACQDLNTMYSN